MNSEDSTSQVVKKRLRDQTAVFKAVRSSTNFGESNHLLPKDDTAYIQDCQKMSNLRKIPLQLTSFSIIASFLCQMTSANQDRLRRTRRLAWAKMLCRFYLSLVHSSTDLPTHWNDKLIKWLQTISNEQTMFGDASLHTLVTCPTSTPLWETVENLGEEHAGVLNAVSDKISVTSPWKPMNGQKGHKTSPSSA